VTGVPQVALTDDYREAPVWLDDVVAPLPAAEPLARSCDAVVVGGGITGLAAAIELAAHDRDVVLVDRHDLGWGASTRNAGMVLPEYHHPPDELERRHGARGIRLQTALDEAFEWSETLDERVGLDTGYRRTGLLRLAHDEAAARGLRALVDQVAARGHPAVWLTGDDLADEIGSARFVGAARLDRAGALHPARFHAGLVTRAIESGVRCHPRTPVVGIRSGSAGFEVRTTAGRVRADTVVVALNASPDRLVPALRAVQLGVSSFVIATEPLPAEVASSLLPRGRVAYDSRHLLAYWRLTPDDRLLFGGRDTLESSSVSLARDGLAARMLGVFPQLEGVRVARAWGGRVAITRDRLPHIGCVDGVWFVTGGNGTGVSILPWAAARLARWLCGAGERPVFADLPLRRFPLPALASAYLPLVGRWLGWRDGR
jgi:glycine/D-amino acid oxidase-like deaminating enzyme